MTLIFGSYFAIAFSPRLNIRGFVRFSNFGVTFSNKFKRGDWGLVIRVGVNITIKHIDSFPRLLHFVLTHTIQKFIERENLEDLGTLKVVVISIYGRSSKIISF